MLGGVVTHSAAMTDLVKSNKYCIELNRFTGYAFNADNYWWVIWRIILDMHLFFRHTLAMMDIWMRGLLFIWVKVLRGCYFLYEQKLSSNLTLVFCPCPYKRKNCVVVLSSPKLHKNQFAFLIRNSLPYCFGVTTLSHPGSKIFTIILLYRQEATVAAVYDN